MSINNEEKLRADFAAICENYRTQISILKIMLAPPQGAEATEFARKEANRQARETVRNTLELIGVLSRKDPIEFRETIALANEIVREGRDLIKQTA